VLAETKSLTHDPLLLYVRQMLDVRDVVDPPGDQSRVRRPEPDDSPARPRLAAGAPDAAVAPLARAEAEPQPNEVAFHITGD
jgi:hypothetical protein